MANDSINQFTQQLANAYVGYYDVYRDDKIGELPLAFTAIYKRRDERYFITKSVKVWGAENQQFVFVQAKQSPISMDDINRLQSSIRQRMPDFIPQKDEHMSSVFIGVIVTDRPITAEVMKEVKKYRKLRFFKFGFHGWAEMYMAVVSLNDASVYIHRKGKPFIETIGQILEKEESVT